MLERSLSDANTHMQSITKMQAIMANHQVMIKAPDEVRQKYFDEVFELNLLEAKNGHLEEEVEHAKLHRRMREAQKKEKESDKEDDATTMDNCNNRMKKTHNFMVVFLVGCSLFGKQRSCNKTWLIW